MNEEKLIFLGISWEIKARGRISSKHSHNFARKCGDSFPAAMRGGSLGSLFRRLGFPHKSLNPSLLPAAFCTHDDPSQNSRFKIFDRDLKRKQRDRAAWLMRGKDNDTFVDAVAENLLDRLEDCKRTFPTALCLGGSLKAVRRLLRGRGGIQKLIMMDMSYDTIKFCRDAEANVSDDGIETFFMVGDEEFLPIKESSVDLVISCLGLHWTNDLPGAMIQCRLALKPDGLFLAAILGGETLKELRIACTIAQMEREGGISPRISPLAQVRDAGNLLTRAGFTLPGVDVDEYTVRYDSALELIEHLRAMGETNALLQRNNILKKETALATAAVYQSLFGAEDGTVPATFQVMYMTGWREHPSQQKAKRRGSANISFSDIQKEFGSNG
ncbi:putative methyltransferase [Cinnamomum micranthum f. kanehirae]|uniref:Putative methyltransferase n=1 Tax=Cinnamomum micranthum f. kanehirae TaxID=337451 RepID=A0A443PHS7_9MAGN|nr:putative methyltransferase [Cinnamomum micranthum f. kanehirae]